MKILINNLDDLGYIDYTAFLQFGTSAAIMRHFNEPTQSQLTFMLGANSIVPKANARVRIENSSGAPLFTGFVISIPIVSSEGEQTACTVHTIKLNLISDEGILDLNAWTTQTTLLGQSTSNNWKLLDNVATKSGLPLNLSSQPAVTSRVLMNRGARWSDLAGILAGNTQSTYRAIDGSIKVVPVGTVEHHVSSNDPGLKLTSHTIKDLRWLASDITVIGHEEPQAYVTEVFEGDGVTKEFRLTKTPFKPKAAQRTSIVDSFQGTFINPQLWVTVDAGGHIALTANGLTCVGGSGRDGESSVSSVQTLEMGGNIVIEIAGIRIQPASEGVIGGLYTSNIQSSNCFAGFAILNSSNAISVTAIVEGTAFGSTFLIDSSREYIFRMRLSIMEVERVRQTYFYRTEEGPASIGGNVVEGGGWITFEVQDTTGGVVSLPIILYSGEVLDIPPACNVGLVCSGSLFCSLTQVRCMQSGPVLVELGISAAISLSQHIGLAAEGAACRVTSSNSIEFYPASVPSVSTPVIVQYRSVEMAVARQTAKQAEGLPKTTGGGTLLTAWAGSVTSPPAWSSIDCSNAVTALLAAVESGTCFVQGIYTKEVAEIENDIWPGDSLNVDIGGSSANAVIRSSELELLGSNPDLLTYRVQFADGWAHNLSILMSTTVPVNAIIPQDPQDMNMSMVESITKLRIKAITGGAITVYAGLEAPAGGGFEVRRRDYTFGLRGGSDLVLRTSSSSFTIPVSWPGEQFFIRMFDGANSPSYSDKSAVLIVNVST